MEQGKPLATPAVDFGLTVLVDRPFAGALVPAKHYRSQHRVSSIMIEVNRRFYMDLQAHPLGAKVRGLFALLRAACRPRDLRQPRSIPICTTG